MLEDSMSVGTLRAVPCRPAISVEPSATVLETARLMDLHRVGAVVVMSEGRCAGIFTAWDVLRVCIRHPGKYPEHIPISEAMTHKVILARPEDSLEESISLMAKLEIGYLPLLAEDQSISLLHRSDLLHHRSEMVQKRLAHLEEYLSDLLEADRD
jgi:CBS domain-containing protein